MKYFSHYRILLALILFLVVAINSIAQIPEDPITDPGHNIQITESKFSGVGGISTTPGGEISLEMSSIPPSRLAQMDYQEVYSEAQTLLDIGVGFRLSELQVPVSNGTGYGPRLGAATLEEALLNYADFNNGTLFKSFCADYNQVSEQGYCPDGTSVLSNPDFVDVRNKLIRARDLFSVLALAHPEDVTVTYEQSNPIAAQTVGRDGVLATTREIANIHLIFGNEFLVDAIDYRFAAGALPSGEQIILAEIEQLDLALQQFQLAFDVLSHAFNADIGGPTETNIGDYFGNREFELFDILSERLIVTIEETAKRHRQLGNDEQAMSLYENGFTTQYLQSLALAQKAADQNADFLDNGGFELISNLGRLRTQAQAIRDGLNPFGYENDYVPLQTYTELFSLTRDTFLRDATEDELAARDAQREFDQNATALNQELQNLRLTYDTQLLELCGASSDDYQTCEGGLMEQNGLRALQAYAQIRSVETRMENTLERVNIELERAGRVITLILETGQEMALLDYVIALNSSFSKSKGKSTSRGSTIGVSTGVSISPFPPGGSASFSVSASWSRTHGTSESTSWNPNSPKIAHLTKVKTVRQSAERAQIEGANSRAVIRNLLLEHAELMIQLELAHLQFSQAMAEHNQLVEKYNYWLNLRSQAQQNVLDSYLNNPAYRILREQQTIEAARSHDLAAHFAYLTAKALEYEFLEPVSFLGDIFKARTADDIDNFLVALEQRRVALGSPGERNRFPYRISLARDLLGLSDENLDPDGDLTPGQLEDLRYQEFQAFLQQNLDGDQLKIQFTTSLLNNQIFSSNIWNSRIAGVGLPADVPNTAGVAVDISTRQFGNIDTPEVILTHGGQASYQRVNQEIIEYVPANAAVIGYPIPSGFESKTKTAVLLANVGGNDDGTPSSALFNRSVAASNWTLQIDRNSPYNSSLDISQITDIEILMDTTGIAVPGQTNLAVQESQRLVAEFEQSEE